MHSRAFFGLVALAFFLVAGTVPAEAKRKYAQGLVWKVTPATAVIYLDGKKLGPASKIEKTGTRSGKHTIRFVHGLDETEFQVSVKKKAWLTLEYVFEE